MTLVDTEAMAVHLGISPGAVRKRVRNGRLVTVGRPRSGQRGRPGMWFDLDAQSVGLTTTPVRTDIDH